MAQATSLTVTEAEYEAIEAAVMETARGRWFLGEFARRNRTADTQMLLQAITRLEQRVAEERSTQDIERLRFDLMEMAKAISLTKTEIAALRPADHPHSHLLVASEALDAITRTTERATSEILDAAEHIQEAAWTLREAGADVKLCDELDRRATEIYTACSFQDLTAQRIARIVQTLRYLEGRINAMIDIWGGAAPGVPESGREAPPAPDLRPGKHDHPDLSQTDVDIVVENELFAGSALGETAHFDLGPVPIEFHSADDLAFVEVSALPSAASAVPAMVEAGPPEPSGPPPLRMEAFAEIDALETREKLRRFS